MDREIIMEEVINFLSFLYILLVMFFFSFLASHLKVLWVCHELLAFH